MPIAAADRRRDRGSVLPFAVTVVAALLACAGLAVDGGRIQAARREAAAIAAAAARRGSQELGWRDLATGHSALDPRRAEAAAESYVGQAGARGSASASTDEIAVTVTIDEPTVILGAFGIGPKSVSARRVASPFSGG
jgi:hypothetical protein